MTLITLNTFSIILVFVTDVILKKDWSSSACGVSGGFSRGSPILSHLLIGLSQFSEILFKRALNNSIKIYSFLIRLILLKNDFISLFDQHFKLTTLTL